MIIFWCRCQTVPDHIIKNRALRTGDGTHLYSIEAAIEESEKKQQLEELNNNNTEKVKYRQKLEAKDDKFPENFWGFGDKDMTSEDLRRVKILKIA
jgi:hypothetical protein